MAPGKSSNSRGHEIRLRSQGSIVATFVASTVAICATWVGVAQNWPLHLSAWVCIPILPLPHWEILIKFNNSSVPPCLLLLKGDSGLISLRCCEDWVSKYAWRSETSGETHHMPFSARYHPFLTRSKVVGRWGPLTASELSLIYRGGQDSSRPCHLPGRTMSRCREGRGLKFEGSNDQGYNSLSLVFRGSYYKPT